MNLKFEINSDLLAALAVLNRAKNLPEFTPLLNELWKSNKEAMDAFRWGLPTAKIVIDHNSKEYFDNLENSFSKVINETKKNPLFEELLNETEKYKKWIEKEWESKKDEITTHLKDILRIDISTDPFIVYLASPKIGTGQHLGSRRFVFGDKEQWDHYSLVYLAHEWLHEYLPKGKVSHAIHELAIDNELRKRLNNLDKYKLGDKESVGHDSLSELRQKILPEWEKYLSEEGSNIHQFIEMMIKDHQPSR